jgi:hypothetical protein
VITKIVTDPKGFFKNLGKGIGQGFKNFVKNIKKHLIKGLINWLTGSLGDTGLVLPQTWNLKGIFSLFLQIMGLSYNFLRSRLVKYVGEPVVAAAEGTFEMIKNIRKEGPIALWKWIKEKAAEIKQTIFDGIRNWVIVQVVKKAILKLVSMLNPAGAIVQAILTIYDVVMFFVDNWDRIVETVKTIFSTISDIAFGRVGIVAKKVESIMAMTIPMIISFLARFLGLSGLAKVIKNLIKKVRQPVVKVVDKAAKWIAKKIKKIAKKIKKFGKKAKKKVKKGAQKIIQWWKVRKSFKGKDGKSHKVYFSGKGKNAKLMIASKPTSFRAFIRNIDTKGSKDKERAKTKALDINKEINRILRKKDYPNKQKDLKKSFDELSVQLAILYEGENVHTGTYEDPIPIRWTKVGLLKAIIDLIPKDSVWTSRKYLPPDPIERAPYNQKTELEIPPTMADFNGQYTRERGGNVARFIKIGVNSDFIPKRKKRLKRGGTRKDSTKNRFRNTLLKSNYNVSMGGYDMDHVLDLGFGGQDEVPNLWPLESGMNRTFGTKVYDQVVSYKDTDGKIKLDKPKNLRGKWFIIDSIGSL